VYAGGLVAVVIATGNASARLVAGVYVAAAVGSALVAAAMVPRAHRRLVRPDREFARRSLVYGLPVTASVLGYSLNRQLPVILVGAIGGVEDAGQWAVAVGYSLPVSVVAVGLAFHTLPDVAAATDPIARASVVASRTRQAFVLTVPLVAASYLLAPTVVPLAFGSSFEAAIDIAQVLLLAQAALAITHLFSEVSRGLGRPALPAATEWMGVVVTACLLPIVISAEGLPAAAGTLAVLYSAMAGVLFVRNRAGLAAT
jgi:O-antigen/teichoic acid export membrane protein